MPTDSGPSAVEPDPLAELARQLGLSRIEGTYAHGYRAANWLARHNMGLEGTLFSTEMLTLTQPDSFPSIRDVPVDSLAQWRDVPAVALLPRATNLISAYNIRLARSYGRPLAELGLNDEQADRVLRLASLHAKATTGT